MGKASKPWQSNKRSRLSLSQRLAEFLCTKLGLTTRGGMPLVYDVRLDMRRHPFIELIRELYARSVERRLNKLFANGFQKGAAKARIRRIKSGGRPDLLSIDMPLINLIIRGDK